jgi:hypothetical protein
VARQLLGRVVLEADRVADVEHLRDCKGRGGRSPFTGYFEQALGARSAGPREHDRRGDGCVLAHRCPTGRSSDTMDRYLLRSRYTATLDHDTASRAFIGLLLVALPWHAGTLRARSAFGVTASTAPSDR